MPRYRFRRDDPSQRRLQFWMITGIVVVSLAGLLARIFLGSPPPSYEAEVAAMCRPMYQEAKNARDTTVVDLSHPSRTARSGAGGGVELLSCGPLRARGLTK